jgi:rhodanese-related sulfurtransferase
MAVGAGPATPLADQTTNTRNRFHMNFSSSIISKLLFSLGMVSLLITGLAAPLPAQGEKPAVAVIPKDKQTVLGLYLYSKEAYAVWQKNPKTVKIIDCRTPEEYVFVGHPPMAYNIPVKFMTHKWDEAKQNYLMEDNADFVSQVQKVCRDTDTILVICRFGNRTAVSVNKLAAAGLKNVYSIVDGFEGELINGGGKDFIGQCTRHGWKNSGAPWTYELNPELVYAGPPKK